MLISAVWKLSAELQSYVISKRLKLQIFAWSRFVEFFNIFKMLMDFFIWPWLEPFLPFNSVCLLLSYVQKPVIRWL